MSFATTNEKPVHREKLKFGQGHLIHKREDNVMITIPLSILYDIEALADDFTLEGFDEVDDIDAIRRDVERNEKALESISSKISALVDEAEKFDERNKLSELVEHTPKPYKRKMMDAMVLDNIFGNNPFGFPFSKGGMVPPCL